MTSQLQQSAALALLAAHGQVGGKAITGTSAVTPADGFYFIAIQVIADAAVSAQGDVTGATNPDLTALTTIKAGTTVYGKFNSITLTNGEAIGYYSKV